MKRFYLSIFFLFTSLVFSCGTDVENQIITEKTVKDEGIRTIAYPKKFENRESYSLYLQGLECIRRDEYKQAKVFFEKALKIDPKNSIIINDLGLTEKRLCNYDIASELFKKAIGLDSTYYEAYGNLGLNLYYDEKFNEAIQILKLPTIDSTSRIERGAIYYHLFMNFTKLENCDSAYHYYSLLKEFATNKIFLENVEEFKEDEFEKNCRLKNYQ